MGARTIHLFAAQAAPVVSQGTAWWVAVLIGVGSSVVASAIFLAGMRFVFGPKIGLSEHIADQTNRNGAQVFRIKVVNQRRFTDAVNLAFELVTIDPIAMEAGEAGVSPFIEQRTTLKVRPEAVVSLPPYRKHDREAKYAMRLTTSECVAITDALNGPSSSLRLRVYAEHAWSRRGKIFEQTYSTGTCIKRGNFFVGRSLDLKT